MRPFLFLRIELAAMPRGKRIRIAKNVYRDRYGIAGVVRLRQHTEELRFPLGTPLPEMHREMDARLRQLESLVPDTPARGTTGAIVQTYLDRFQVGAHRNDREDLLTPWVDALGDRPFYSMSRAELQAVADGWIAAGLSHSRANKRISALRVAWAAIAPDHAQPHPIAKVTRYREPLAQQRAIPMELVTHVLDAVRPDGPTPKGKVIPPPPSKSKARLAVLAWTGQPPARVMAIRPEHVRWDTHPPELYVVARRKGTGSTDAWLPLLPHAVEALRGFFAAQATGTFQTAPLGRVMKRAIKKVQAELRTHGRHDDAALLESFRLYDLRHSFLTAFGRWTKDVYATAEYAGHASLQTTRRYMKGAASDRMKAGINTLTKMLPGVPRQASTTPRRKVARKRA